MWTFQVTVRPHRSSQTSGVCIHEPSVWPRPPVFLCRSFIVPLWRILCDNKKPAPFVFAFPSLTLWLGHCSCTPYRTMLFLLKTHRQTLSFGHNLMEKGRFHLKQTFILASLFWLQACGAEPTPGLWLCNRETGRHSFCFCRYPHEQMSHSGNVAYSFYEVTPIITTETCRPVLTHVSKCHSFIQQLFYLVVSTWQPRRRMSCEPAGLVSIHWVNKQSTEQIKQLAIPHVRRSTKSHSSLISKTRSNGGGG